MTTQKKLLLTTTVIAGLAIAAPSFAQSQQQGQAQTQQQQQQQQQQASDVQEVVVTGSRIRRNEFTSSSPIQVITQERATLEGLVDTTEIIQNSTIANTATQINNFFTGFVTTGGPGTNTVSLRGLGANRTLILLNGRRLGPAGLRGTVGPTDLNVFPSSIIERIEILKDGASAVYGSDAIAGVINIITRTKLDGGNIGVNVVAPFAGAGEEFRINAGWGQTFDRGYFSVGADYYRREPVLWGDREDLFGCGQDFVWDQQGNRLDLIDPATGKFKCQNLVTNRLDNASTGRQYIWDPTATAGSGFGADNLNGLRRVNANYGGAPGSAAYEATRASFAIAPNDRPEFRNRTAISPVTRYSLNAFGGFDLTENTEAYGELMFNRRESEQKSLRQLFPLVSASNPQNPFRSGNPDGYPVGIGRPIILMPSNSDQQVDYYRGVAGLRGSLPEIGFIRGWEWDLVAQMSRSEGTYGGNFFYNDRIVATTGATACALPANPADNLSNFNCGMVPAGGIRWFHPDVLKNSAFTDAERNFLFGYEQGTTIYEHKYIEGVINGDLFNVPAGAVSAALGFQFRKEKLDDTPGPVQISNNLWGQTSAGRTAGDDTIKEYFGELEVPILRGMTFAERLTFNVSGRYSQYDSYATDSKTYKAGLNWQITPQWRIRAAQGTSFRAPALYELFLANQTGFLGQAQIDACINWGQSTNPILRQNCAADGIADNYTGAGTSSATIFTGGGAGVLEAETARNKTLGLIWTPTFVDLSVGVDYFDIRVRNQVAQFGAANVVRACYTAEDFPTSPFCSLFTRAPNTSVQFPQIMTVNNSFVNIAEQTNRGVDLNMAYRHQFPFADMRIDGQFTWILEWETSIFGGAPTQNHGRVGSPDFTGRIDTRFDRGPWTFFWSAQAIGKQSDTDAFGGDLFTYRNFPGAYWKQYAEFTTYHTTSVRYRFDTWTIQGGIQNVFDETPPIVSTSGPTRIGNVALGGTQQDWAGRTGFISVVKTF